MGLLLRVPTRLLNRAELLSLLKSLSHTRAHARQTKYGTQWVHDYFKQSKEERAALVSKLAKKLARGDHHEAIGTLAQATLVAKRLSRQAPMDVHVTQGEDGRYGVTAKPKTKLDMPVVAAGGKAYAEHPVAGRVEMNAVLAGRGLHQVGRRTLEKHAHVVAAIDGTDHATALAKLHGQQREAVAARLAAGKTVAARVVEHHGPEVQAQLAELKAEKARKREARAATRLSRQVEREARQQRNLAREQARTTQKAEQARVQREKRRAATGRKPGAQPGNDNARGAHDVPPVEPVVVPEDDTPLPPEAHVFTDEDRRKAVTALKAVLGDASAFNEVQGVAAGPTMSITFGVKAPEGSGYPSKHYEVTVHAGWRAEVARLTPHGRVTVYAQPLGHDLKASMEAIVDGATAALVDQKRVPGAELSPVVDVGQRPKTRAEILQERADAARRAAEAQVVKVHENRYELAEAFKAALGPAGERLQPEDFKVRRGGMRASAMFALPPSERKVAFEGLVKGPESLEMGTSEGRNDMDLSWSLNRADGTAQSYRLDLSPGGQVELQAWVDEPDNFPNGTYEPVWRAPVGTSLEEAQAGLAQAAEATLVHAGLRPGQTLPPLPWGTGRDPGAQLGNDNGKGNRGKKKARSPIVEQPREIEGLSLDEVKQLITQCVEEMHESTHWIVENQQMEKDGVGFNAPDASFAKQWLRMHYKTDLDYVVMADMLIKYREQLGPEVQKVMKGMVKAAMPKPDPSDEPEVPRFKWAINAAGWVLGTGESQGERPPMCIYAKGDGQYGVQFKYNPDFVASIKELVPAGQRSWDKERKEWSVHALAVQKLLDGFGHRVGMDLESHRALAGVVAAAQGAAEQQAATEAEKQAAELAEARVLTGDELPQIDEYVLRGLKAVKAKPYITLEKSPGRAPSHEVAVKFNKFSPELKDRLRQAVPARWEPNTKSWLVAGRDMEKVMTLFPEVGMDQAVYQEHGRLLSMSADDLREALGMRRSASKEDTDFQEPAGWSTHTMHAYQRKGANWLLKAKKGILGFGVGLGKCLGYGTPVMMADGTIKPVQDIENGDRVMGPDSQPRTVMGVNRGRGPLYRIEPVKGDPWVCNDVHVLTLRQSVGGAVFDIPLDKYLANKDSRALRDAKLFRVPVSFPARATALDPYILGVWLGDGHAHRPNIHTVDEPVIEYLVREAPKYGVTAKVSPQRTCTDVYMTTALGSRQRNVVLEEIRRCWVAEEKRIPADYLRNGERERLLLLAGLIDTDGHLSGGCYEVTTKYAGLRDDVLYLARSLGFAAYASEKVATIKETGGTYWRIYISGDLDRVPCLVQRRQAPARQSKKRVTNTGFKAVPLGEGDFYGFTLDGDGRFLLGDFTVTHNTNISIAAACKAQEEHPGRPVVCTVPGKRLYGWKADIEAAMPGKKVFVFDQGTSVREQLKKAGDLAQYDFIIVTYRMQTLEKDHLLDLKPCALIYDEAHKLKNKGAQQTQAAIELSQAAPYVWDLTATPMPNTPEELMVLIGRNHGKNAIPSKDLYGRYYSVVEQHIGGGRYVKKVTGIKDPAGLKEAIAPYVFMKRGDDADVNLNLPPLRKGRTTLPDLQFEPDQKRAYNKASADILAYIKSIGKDPSAAERAKVLVRMGQLEQIAITPELVDPSYTKRTPKMQELLDEIENREGEFPGKGHVVFCRFARALQIAKREVLAEKMFAEHEIAIIDGSTAKVDVQRIQDDLNAGRVKLVLCSDAAMEGLNFQKGSNHMVHLDTPWSPYMQEQRDGRVYRQGQPEPVRIQTIAQGPIDAHKDLLSMRKEAMNAQLFGTNPEEAVAGAITVADLTAMARGV